MISWSRLIIWSCWEFMWFETLFKKYNFNLNKNIYNFWLKFLGLFFFFLIQCFVFYKNYIILIINKNFFFWSCLEICSFSHTDKLKAHCSNNWLEKTSNKKMHIFVIFNICLKLLYSDMKLIKFWTALYYLLMKIINAWLFQHYNDKNKIIKIFVDFFYL